ncbi:hypothetical protein ACIBCA_33375 [Kitasatospora sp. NPDC051170]|uniref:hypothetical protein n=1 Tax=Kitasatospora sp. NPDC051170 TaxID=3364056 RepID=UPI0037BDA5FD
MHVDADAAETARWNRIGDLLPDPAAAREFKDARLIGEQEAGIVVLVERLLAGQVPLGGEDRARISVLAETWGLRQAVTPGLVRCLGDGGPTPVQLLDGDADEAEVLTGRPEPELAGLVLAPWIGCTRCGRVLLRAHDWEDWDDLSQHARRYVITGPERGPALRILPGDAAEEAFAALLEDCPAA